MMVWGLWLDVLVFMTHGSPKAKVLPEPVLDCANTSSPSSIGLMAFACISVIALNPSVSSVSSNAAGMPSRVSKLATILPQM